MKQQFFTGVALAALAMPGAAFAQSTGTIDAEQEIVVTATRAQEGVKGVISPDSPKARTILTQEAIGRQAAGQSILNTINVVPGVNFTNNDPYGSSGGNIRIRGFDGARVSLTFDGVPLNDTGNYAIFSNQQLDPEIIEQVNVNQGTTDIDSPTASASGGTVNYRTIVPSNDYGAFLQPSYGDFNYHRLFGILQSGAFTKFGTKMFASASIARNDKFRGPGEIFKQQYNGRIYQPIGENGDFISISGHYNQNRNNSYRNNLTLAQAGADYADNRQFDYDNNATCLRPAFVSGTAQNESTGATGVVGAPLLLQTSTAIRGTTSVTNPQGLDTSCTNYFGARINPSNTGNVRISSKFTVAPGLVLTVDPSFQFVRANGGGFATVSETDLRLRGANSAVGVDLSGDGDTLDTVALYAPNNTETRRYGLLASLRYDLSPSHYVRLSYTFDRGRHRQTGAFGRFDINGNPVTPFAGVDGPSVITADGLTLRGRDRLSIALLNQISGEYRGKFLDNKLAVTVGLRAPFFHRELNQYCYVQAGNGTQYCSSQPVSTLRIIGVNDPIPTTGATAYYAPFNATYNYNRILPSAGFTYKVTDALSVFGNYSDGFNAPRTDNLYRQPQIAVTPETSKNFDLGVRYTSRTFQFQVNGYYNKLKNRIVTSFDPVQNISIDRNVGAVENKGFDASVDVQPFSWLYFHGFASYIDARLKDNLALTPTITALTAGKKVVETPEWQFGYRAEVNYSAFSLGVQFKKVGARFATDTNDIRLPSYTTVDLDGRVSLASLGLKQTYIQMNVINLFDTKYLGSISSQIAGPIVTAANIIGTVNGVAIPVGAALPSGANPTFAPGSPRTVLATLRIGF